MSTPIHVELARRLVKIFPKLEFLHLDFAKKLDKWLLNDTLKNEYINLTLDIIEKTREICSNIEEIEIINIEDTNKTDDTFLTKFI